MNSPRTPASNPSSSAAEKGEGRQEQGGEQQTSRERPHATENDREAGQIRNEADQTVPAMPANASGSDRVSTEDQDQGIDPESMYDRRPAEDKNRPPSSQS